GLFEVAENGNDSGHATGSARSSATVRHPRGGRTVSIPDRLGQFGELLPGLIDIKADQLLKILLVASGKLKQALHIQTRLGGQGDGGAERGRSSSGSRCG